MSANALAGVVVPNTFSTTTATGDVTLSAGDEVLLVPTTRVVVVSSALPTASEGISAEWTTSPASRVSGAAYEYAEIRCYVDLANGVLTITDEAVDDVIGVTDDAASLGQVTATQFGTILTATMTCLELPTVGDPAIDLFSNPTVLVAGAAKTGTELLNSGDWEVGTVTYLTRLPAANEYLHLSSGNTSTNNYAAGKFMITFHCRFTL
jgi:hypothetical protein